ncbi:MAG: sulfatase-like hydrolase/transferase, partial [Candidatus Hydrogenedentota bacterium]
DAPSWDYVYNPIGRDKTEEDKIFTLIPGNYGSVSSWLAADGTDDEQTDGKGALEIMRLLEEQAETDEPFFLAYGIYRPHAPYVAPKKYFDLYDLKDIVVPPDAVAREPYAAYQNAKPVETLMTDELKRRAIRAYYATTTFMDAQVGRVLNKLEELGLAENTIVVFTSDHGYQLGEHGLWRKRALFERAARAPLIIRTPDELSAGKRTSQLVELVDLYPTLAALAGLRVSGPLSGMDLSRVLKNPESFTRKAALTQDMRNYKIDEKRYRYSGNSIRTEQYRYTEWDGGKQGLELYDHDTDPEELLNLAHDKDYADVADEMRGLLAARLYALRQVDLSEWR